ncbi:MAG TPA: CocE/NonD family hydrolase, partial [Solirubrobacteraceae bacterium]
AVVPGVNLVDPLASAARDPTHGPQAIQAELRRATQIPPYDLQFLAKAYLGGPNSFDNEYWHRRAPGRVLQDVVANGIPAYLVGGWFDLFQRGEPLNYASFQNAYRHRPLLAPMGPKQQPTGRYQLLQGPWYHVTYGQGLDYRGLDLDGIELAWFDRWLKGRRTGIAATRKPQHLYDLGTSSWKDTARYPVEHAKPRAYYLGAGGSLETKAPKGASGADQLVFTGSRIPCSNSAEQWAAGLGVLATSYLGIQDPCAQDASLAQQGPAQQSYETKPFAKATTLAGPIGATLFATSTTPDTEWVVDVSDVAPNGHARQLTSGLLEGMQRAVIHDHRTWKGVGGRPILPYHRYTKAALKAAVPGKVTRYDVEVFPTFATLAKGHRLRVTVATSDFPHALPSVTQLPGLAGGVYELQRRRSAASSVQLPLAPVGSFATAHG